MADEAEQADITIDWQIGRVEGKKLNQFQAANRMARRLSGSNSPSIRDTLLASLLVDLLPEEAWTDQVIDSVPIERGLAVIRLAARTGAKVAGYDVVDRLTGMSPKAIEDRTTKLIEEQRNNPADEAAIGAMYPNITEDGKAELLDKLQQARLEGANAGIYDANSAAELLTVLGGRPTETGTTASDEPAAESEAEAEREKRRAGYELPFDVGGEDDGTGQTQPFRILEDDLRNQVLQGGNTWSAFANAQSQIFDVQEAGGAVVPWQDPSVDMTGMVPTPTRHPGVPAPAGTMSVYGALQWITGRSTGPNGELIKLQKQMQAAGLLDPGDYVPGNLDVATINAWRSTIEESWMNRRQVSATLAERQAAIRAQVESLDIPGPNESEFNYQANRLGETILGRKLRPDELVTLRESMITMERNQLRRRAMALPEQSWTEESQASYTADLIRNMNPDEASSFANFSRAWDLLQAVGMRPKFKATPEQVQMYLAQGQQQGYTVDRIMMNMLLNQGGNFFEYDDAPTEPTSVEDGWAQFQQ